MDAHGLIAVASCSEHATHEGTDSHGPVARRTPATQAGSCRTMLIIVGETPGVWSDAQRGTTLAMRPLQRMVGSRS